MYGAQNMHKVFTMDFLTNSDIFPCDGLLMRVEIWICDPGDPSRSICLF